MAHGGVGALARRAAALVRRRPGQPGPGPARGVVAGSKPPHQVRARARGRVARGRGGRRGGPLAPWRPWRAGRGTRPGGGTPPSVGQLADPPGRPPAPPAPPPERGQRRGGRVQGGAAAGQRGGAGEPDGGQLRVRDVGGVPGGAGAAAPAGLRRGRVLGRVLPRPRRRPGPRRPQRGVQPARHRPRRQRPGGLARRRRPAVGGLAGRRGGDPGLDEPDDAGAGVPGVRPQGTEVLPRNPDPRFADDRAPP